jgi:hypothetical protein
MASAMVGSFRDLIEIVVTAVSILGGFMAFYSGLEASRSVQARQSPDQVASLVNRGLARGFGIGFPVAVAVSVTLALM